MDAKDTSAILAALTANVLLIRRWVIIIGIISLFEFFVGVYIFLIRLAFV